MLTERFNRLWTRLVTLWFAYEDVPRTPDDVVDLAAARVALDGIRSEIAVERSRLSATARPTNTLPRVAVSEETLARLRVAGAGMDHA
jgi:hypothetical protein